MYERYRTSTTLNNGIPIVVKAYVTNADSMPCDQVILYPWFVPEVTLRLSNPPSKNL